MPKLRQEAVRLLSRGWSARKVGRHLGFHHTAIRKWMKHAQKFGDHPIPTRSSRPRTHPKKISDDIVSMIVKKRLAHNRYAEALHHELKNEGIEVSLSSVKRTLDQRYLLKKKSPWKRFHPHVERPQATKPGDLVQMDTIHRMINDKKRLYIFVIIDVYSRWVYAKAFARMNAATTLKFLEEAQKASSFHFTMLQSDHGPEFGRWFVTQAKRNHRYTRIGKPNDNAHIERFNRTVQEECLDKVPTNVRAINCALKKYLKYYNCERLHAGINFLTPIQLVPSY